MGRILVIDDDPTYCKVVSVHLSRAGHEVSSTDDGKTAMGLIARGGIDLVLLDLSMPKMLGPAFLEVLRSDASRRVTPVIIVSANLEGEHFAEARKLGIQGVFDKTTLKYPELIEAIEGLLR